MSVSVVIDPLAIEALGINCFNSLTDLESEPFLYDFNGELLECASSCIITDTTKTLKNFMDLSTEYIEWEVE